MVYALLDVFVLIYSIAVTIIAMIGIKNRVEQNGIDLETISGSKLEVFVIWGIIGMWASIRRSSGSYVDKPIPWIVLSKFVQPIPLNLPLSKT